jgi:hypothetical protein
VTRRPAFTRSSIREGAAGRRRAPVALPGPSADGRPGAGAGGGGAEEAERAVPGVAAARVPDDRGVAGERAGRAPGAGRAAGARPARAPRAPPGPPLPRARAPAARRRERAPGPARLMRSQRGRPAQRAKRAARGGAGGAAGAGRRAGADRVCRPRLQHRQEPLAARPHRRPVQPRHQLGQVRRAPLQAAPPAPLCMQRRPRPSAGAAHDTDPPGRGGGRAAARRAPERRPAGGAGWRASPRRRSAWP